MATKIEGFEFYGASGAFDEKMHSDLQENDYENCHTRSESEQSFEQAFQQSFQGFEQTFQQDFQQDFQQEFHQSFQDSIQLNFQDSLQQNHHQNITSFQPLHQLPTKLGFQESFESKLSEFNEANNSNSSIINFSTFDGSATSFENFTFQKPRANEEVCFKKSSISPTIDTQMSSQQRKTSQYSPEIQLNSAGSSLFPEIEASQFDSNSSDYVPLTPIISL